MNNMLLMCIALAIIGINALIISFYLSKHTKQINTEIEAKNQKLSNKNTELAKTYEIKQLELTNAIQNLKEKEKEISNQDELIKKKTLQISELFMKADAAAAAESKLQRQAFENYCDVLENEYIKIDTKFELDTANLKEQIQKVKDDLASISETRAAARAALQREQEIKDNKDNYRLIVSNNDLEDIHRLERVKKELHKPRILSMLIWQTYWQPIAKKRFPEILHDKTKIGIYKITNLETDECYIGQSVDIYKRWCEHCKCGLGIDTPPGNKLYKAIQEYGLENFTFELLTECPVSALNTKEKYFINLYEADTFGYNSTIGNKS